MFHAFSTYCSATKYTRCWVYLINYLSLLCTIGITKPIIIANVKDVFQSTIAPFFSINKFHNNVTIMAAINVITNVNNTFNIIPFAFIVLKIKLLPLLRILLYQYIELSGVCKLTLNRCLIFITPNYV